MIQLTHQAKALKGDRIRFSSHRTSSIREEDGEVLEHSTKWSGKGVGTNSYKVKSDRKGKTGKHIIVSEIMDDQIVENLTRTVCN